MTAADPCRAPDLDGVLNVGARLDQPPAAELLVAFAGELDGQRGLVDEIGLADLAHTLMLVERGLVPSKDGRALLRVLLELQGRPADFILDPAAGDLYTNREAWLSARTPAAAWLGFGRARREATTAAWQLAVRARVLRLTEELASCGRALVERASELRDVLAPDYTYMQPAQPTSFGHTLLTFAFPLLRDLDRLRALHARVDRSPAGCGSANGSRLPQDRRLLAELLGFGGLVAHARDAMWQADLPIECLATVVAALVNLDRLAEDLLFFSTAEVGLVSLADAHARASKILPQKKNPYALTWIRACANEAIGVQAGVAASGRTPSGQIDNRLLAYGEVPRMLDRGAGAAALAAAVVRGLTVDRARGGQLMTQSFIVATDLAEVLVVESGLDHRAAQRVVGVLARMLATSGRRSASLDSADVNAAAIEVTGSGAELDNAALTRALDAARAVSAREGPGGAAAAQMTEMLSACRAELASATTFCVESRARAEHARLALLARASAAAEGA
ncbi:MAG: fumarate lyase [Myxococcaceae bacterium]|nr:fumarate lyase [Myxococcaceae bacterium]